MSKKSTIINYQGIDFEVYYTGKGDDIEMQDITIEGVNCEDVLNDSAIDNITALFWENVGS